jgi:hypothetical protein
VLALEWEALGMEQAACDNICVYGSRFGAKGP